MRWPSSASARCVWTRATPPARATISNASCASSRSRARPSAPSRSSWWRGRWRPSASPQAAQPYLDELDAIAATVATTAAAQASASLAAGVVAAAAGAHETARRRLEDAIELFAKGGAPFETAHAGSSWPMSSPRWAARTRRRARRRRRCAAATSSVPPGRARGRALLLGRLGRTPDGRADGPLTPRQVEVLRLVADGLSDRQIADRLGLSEHTVHRHMQNTYARLRCRSRAAAVAGATRLRLL